MTQRVAIVTGAGRGIGFACAEALLLAGYAVVLGEKDAALARTAEKRLKLQGKALAVRTDVAKEADVKRLVAAAVREFGGLDLLVSNAALADPKNGKVTKLSLAAWNQRLSVNLTSVFLGAKHAAPHLAKRRGSIVNISSTRALMSEPDTEAYAASKGGIDALTHALAISLGPKVRANAVRPGWIDTKAAKLSPAAHAQHPAGRVGVPADIAALVVYLASDAAAFITGQHFNVDGGMTRKMIYD